jgi:hypothetical protein
MGLAFTDALIDHANVRVALIDRRHGVGGHWLEAYPFVRLHQASAFYGVASTMLGGNRVQRHGPEAGLHERASVSEICAYYGSVLTERLLASGQLEHFPGCEYLGDRTFGSRISGKTFIVPDHCKVVDAHYLAPDIPAETPPPFVHGSNVLTPNGLVRLDAAASQYVVVGSGKTATDTCLWLLNRGVDPDALCWIRPREPWMLNRAVVQPDPTVFLGMVGDLLEAATAPSLEAFFLRLEEAGIMLRLDPSVIPTMAKAPTLAQWELDGLRTVENVVRLGHVVRADPGRLELTEGGIGIAADAVVVHCAASGLKSPGIRPIWGPDVITLQPIRAGFPCFGAALAGYVEATRSLDADKNRLCPPTPYANTMREWARMNLLGMQASASFNSEPDIFAWANTLSLNPSRVPAEQAEAARDAQDRVRAAMAPGLAGLARLCS